MSDQIPHHQRHDGQKPGRRMQPEELRFGEIHQCPVQARGRGFPVVHEHQPAKAQHGAQRHDERVDAGLPHDESVDRPKTNPGQQGQGP